MEICCLEECGANSVRPMLVPARCADEPVAFYPCLPACSKTYYCCEKPKPAQHRHEEGPRQNESCPSQHKTEHRYSPPHNQECCYVCPPPPRATCCEPQCKPTKTKYIIPCYRYEDGRIANQPTVLMRRACEVAVGKRPRKKPYEESRFIREADHQESRYIREDEEGNCCFHFEKQKTHSRLSPVGQCASCPLYCMEYPPGVTARPEPPTTQPPQNCYFYNCYNPC